jgi:xylose dehydrogenase (NAD/NADP)
MSVGDKPLRWGVLSTARITDELVPCFAKLPQAELRAVASRDLTRARGFAAAREIPVAYGSYEQLLDDEAIDCVYVPLPNSLHADWTEAALQRGKHVLCEKPMTPRVEEAERLFGLAEREGLVLMEAFMYRHHPKTKALRRLIASGRLGEPRVLRMRFHFQVESPETDIRYDSELAGGALRDVGCYCVSLASYVADAEPEEVSGLARYAPSGIDEVFAGTMRFGSTLLATFDCGMTSPLDVGVEALTTRGRVTVPMPWYPHHEPLHLEVDVDGEHTVEPTPGANAYQLEIANMCSAIDGSSETEITRDETLGNLRTIERLLHAAGAGSPAIA